MIQQPYLLATMCCTCYIDSSGRRYLDRLWAKDLLLHTSYIDRLTITCMRIERDPPESFVAWDSMPGLQRIDVVDLPQLSSIWATITRLPVLVARFWSAIGRATIVHSGVAGWPIPDGWLSIPLARLRGKFVIVVVESDFWRISDPKNASFKRKLRAVISERLNRWCVNAAHVAFFTHGNYKKTLLTRHPERGHVLPASWIDDDSILSQADAEAQWNRKDAKSGALNLLFVGRLIPEKGIAQLLEALQLSQTAPGKVRCDILGNGALMPECVQLAEKLKGKVDIRFLGYVNYGPKFFDLLAAYGAIVVPSLSNEQPRIAFDAFARAIPVLGYATEGLASCVKNDITGKLCPIGVQELATLIDWAFANRAQLREMGMRGLGVARSYTHREMHQSRSRILTACFDASIHAQK